MEHDTGLLTDPKTWIAIAFIIFFVLAGRKLWASVTGILDQRTEEIRAELDEASRLRREAEIMLQDARTRREQALQDAQRMLETARAEAARVGETARAEAAASTTRREQMAMDRISAAEQAAVTDVRMAAADIAARAAHEVIRGGLTSEGDAQLIDRAIQGLPAALTSRRAA